MPPNILEQRENRIHGESDNANDFYFFLIDLKRNLLNSLLMERLIEIIRRLGQLVVWVVGLSFATGLIVAGLVQGEIVAIFGGLGFLIGAYILSKTINWILGN